MDNSTSDKMRAVIFLTMSYLLNRVGSAPGGCIEYSVVELLKPEGKTGVLIWRSNGYRWY